MKESQLDPASIPAKPHFLFNTLNSIYALIDKGDADQASSMVLNLSHFLRYSLEHGATKRRVGQRGRRGKFVSHHRADSFVDRLTVVFSIAEDANEALVPSFVTALIENAIKHAIAQNEDGGIIRVTADADGDMLRVRVEDSGSGHRPSDSARQYPEQAWVAKCP